MFEKISGFIARRWRGLLVWLVITGAFLFWFLPNIQALFPYLVLIFSLLFQLAFAILFMVVQFGALFWFLSRGRTYWILPGETGISFKDYRGQKDILEVSQRIVTLLRGVKEFKRMGGEVSKGLLLVGPPGDRQELPGAGDCHRSGGALRVRLRYQLPADVLRHE